LKSWNQIYLYIKEEIIDIKGKVPPFLGKISLDSRKIESGDIFFAFPGTREDGKKYIPDAINKGAQVIFYEGDLSSSFYAEEILFVKVKDIFKSLGIVASALYDFPAQRLKIIGVTGTNGKTTVTNLLYHFWNQKGLKAGLIGTIEYRIDEEVFSSNFTTPQPHELQDLLRKMVDKNITHVAMEVSSHALSLKRIEGVNFCGTVFTNLTQDHLDFHKTMEDYFQAKLRIFDYLIPSGFSILNKDNEWTKKVDLKDKKVYWVSLYDSNMEIFLRKDISNEKGMYLEIDTPKGIVYIDTKLRGRFNIYNILFAVGALVAMDEDIGLIGNYLSTFSGVKGRLEFINDGQPFNVIVDYAHTPDGLQNLLETISEFNKGKKIVVFGCGGDRDPTKRDKMGSIAAKLSDFIILTSDNPRTEDPMKIIKDIEVGVKNACFSNYIIIENREEAIKTAIEMAEEGDTVVIAGKGHENYQIVGDKRFPFSDQDIARKYIKRKLTKNESYC